MTSRPRGGPKSYPVYFQRMVTATKLLAHKVKQYHSDYFYQFKGCLQQQNLSFDETSTP